GRLVKRTNRDLRRKSDRLEAQRRSTVGAKAALDLVRALEIARRSAGKDEVACGHQSTKKPTECLLAHAAMANRRAAELRGAEADRTALAAAGGEADCHRRSLHLVLPSLLSSTSMPILSSSPRIRSASLKFLALRAALRASIKSTILSSSIVRAAGRHAA